MLLISRQCVQKPIKMNSNKVSLLECDCYERTMKCRYCHSIHSISTPCHTLIGFSSHFIFFASLNSYLNQIESNWRHVLTKAHDSKTCTPSDAIDRKAFFPGVCCVCVPGFCMPHHIIKQMACIFAYAYSHILQRESKDHFLAEVCIHWALECRKNVFIERKKKYNKNIRKMR